MSFLIFIIFICFCENINLKNYIKIKQNKEKMEESKPKGVLSPNWRYDSAILAHWNPGPFDFSWKRVACLTETFHRPWILAFDLILVAMWHAWILSVRWTSGSELHRNMVRKIIWNKEGGPGIRTQIPRLTNVILHQLNH